MPDCTMCLDCFGHDNDTEYTAGFRAGSAFERDRIIKLLEVNDHYSVDWLIELIEEENK